MSDGKIFISYSRKDSRTMQRVKNRMEQAGASVWTDEGLRPGTKDWQMAIERDIEACDAMVILLSPDACKSEWVRREINRADRLGRLVLPIVIKDVPTSLIPLLLENTQHINASSDLDEGLSTLLTELTNRGWVGASPVEQAREISVSKENSAPKPKSPISERLRKLPDSLWAIGIIFGIVLMLIFVIWIGEKVLGPFLGTETSTTEALASSDIEVVTKTPQLINDEFPYFITDTFGVPMALIPGGSFEMGSEDGNDEEKPVHTVMLDDFYIDQYEVTNQLFVAFLNEQGVNINWQDANKDWDSYIYQSGSIWHVISGYADHPIAEVNWSGAKAFCQWRGARLPTEAEWEKATRGGLEGQVYPWGNESPVCDFGIENGAQYWGCGFYDTVVIGSFEANGYGLYDMAGNVWEWVEDWYAVDYYEHSPTGNPLGPNNGNEHVLKMSHHKLPKHENKEWLCF